MTNPVGDATLTCYDGDGQVAQTVPAAGVAANNLTQAACPNAYPSGYGDRLASDATTYSFDGPGHETAATIPAPAGQTGSETTTYSYDGNGNPLVITAPPVLHLLGRSGWKRHFRNRYACVRAVAGGIHL